VCTNISEEHAFSIFRAERWCIPASTQRCNPEDKHGQFMCYLINMYQLLDTKSATKAQCLYAYVIHNLRMIQNLSSLCAKNTDKKETKSLMKVEEYIWKSCLLFTSKAVVPPAIQCSSNVASCFVWFQNVVYYFELRE
jgi:hypothetical protein